MCVAMRSRLMLVECLSKIKLVETRFYYLSYSILNHLLCHLDKYELTKVRKKVLVSNNEILQNLQK